MPRTRTTNVAASPAAAAETVVAAIAPGAIPAGEVADAVDLEATLDLTVGTAGTAVTVRIRRGVDTTGAVLATFGPFTAVAGNRMNLTAAAPDNEVNQGYVVTVQVTAATAASAINAANITAVW